MARALLIFALCVLPALISAARPAKNPYQVVGRVYCDTCRCGYETPKTTSIAGAKVKVECRNRQSMELVYSKEGKTDSEGKYTISVTEDHEDQVCDALLVSSSQPDCAKLSMGRERARVILTNSNGIASTTRYVNAMLFEKDEAEAGCAEVLKLYQENEEDM
ncbi:hypothetical protein SLE2022_116120 [Rubroshorea leprosula]